MKQRKEKKPAPNTRRAQDSLEEARRTNEEKYRALFNSIDEGFCIIDVVFDGDGERRFAT